MLAYWPLLAVLASPGGAWVGMMDVQVGAAASRAERSLDHRRAELGLIGTAPLYGLERVTAGHSVRHDGLHVGARLAREFDARRSELSFIGAAPLYGADGMDAPALAAPQSRRLMTH